MNDGSDRDIVVFTDALRLPAAERGDYWVVLARGMKICGNGWKWLLTTHDRVGDFLSKPPTGGG